jgi:hypothetical protein
MVPMTPSRFNAVDCGAGVGRVTEGFLSHVCEVVDAVEPVAKFTQVMKAGSKRRTLARKDLDPCRSMRDTEGNSPSMLPVVAG